MNSEKKFSIEARLVAFLSAVSVMIVGVFVLVIKLFLPALQMAQEKGDAKSIYSFTGEIVAVVLLCLFFTYVNYQRYKKTDERY